MKRLLLLLLFLAPLFSLAQNKIQTYSGEMNMKEKIFTLRSEWNSNPGDGRYEYYTDAKGNRIKHGQYYFINSSEKRIQSGDKNEIMFHNLSVKGRFVDGKKEGVWKINYESEIYTINYRDDKLDGDYTIQSRRSPGNKVQCCFKDNHFTGTFTVTGAWSITGQFDDEGFADGTWKIRMNRKTPYSFYYVFSHGRYLDSYQYDDSTGEKSKLKKGNSMVSHDEGFFGPINELNFTVYYIRDYLSIRPFENVTPAFMYKENNETLAKRSKNHNDYEYSLEEEVELANRLIEQKRNNEKLAKQKEARERFEREHPYVEYAGDFKKVVLDSLKARLPKFSKWDSINAGKGWIRLSLYVNPNGIVTVEDNPDYSSSPKKTRMIAEEAKRIANETSGSFMWIPGAQGKRISLRINYYPDGRLEYGEE